MRPSRPRRVWRSCAALAPAILAIALTLAAPASASAPVTIGTTGGPGFRGGYEFGGGGSVASIGQVVTVPEGVTSLESFSLSPQVAPSFLFRAYVYAWNGSQTTGPALYESADLHAPSEASFQRLTLQTGGVAVTAGQQYVLFLSRSNEQAADEADTSGYAFQIVRSEGFFEPPPYQEGGLVTLSNGYTPSDWGTQAWSDFGFFYDAEFEATFDVPAPPPVNPPPADPARTAPVTSVLAPSAGPAHCVMPDLGGLRLAAVKQTLSAAHCALGAVEHHWFALPKGELMEQNVHQGTILPVGGKVGVWLSRGPHRRSQKRAH
jgi:hypothetical protein